MENEPRKFRISRKFTKFLWSDLVLLFVDYFVSQESISKGIFKQRSKKSVFFLINCHSKMVMRLIVVD